jgi:dimethylglycine dehydrogenase
MFTTLTLDAEGYDAPYMSNIWHGDQLVGETTSGGWGYRVGKSIALSMLRSDLAAAGTRVEVEIYGTRIPAQVSGDQALWDPENKRLRA